ncbi:MAG: hypothetical protein KJO35_10175 [Gammaproteobacteria bacterium]|nr:hypothetical protein [Gammaproteobacteria bacterium]
MSDGLYLAIDQGGQSTRAIVFDRAGTTIAASYRSVSTQHPAGPEFVEHDPEELIDSILESVADVVANVKSQGQPIVQAGLATQRSSIVCWDRETGAALSPVISWQDTRAADLLRQRSPDEAMVRSITGLTSSPHYGASKLRWCLENIEDVRRSHAKGLLAMGPLAAFIIHRLTRERALLVDPVNASRTLLWDSHTLDWSEKLLAAFAIPAEVLPVCVYNRSDFGHIKTNGIPLSVCTGDQNAAIFAGGELRQGVAYLNIGTGAFILAQIDAGTRENDLLQSVIWAADNEVTRVMEGTVNGAGSALAAHHATPEKIVQAAAAMSTSNIPLYLNGHAGLGSPYWRERFTSQFIGDGDDATKLTAVVESILFLIQVNLEQLCRSVAVSTILVSGGLSRNDDVCQGIADLSGMVVSRPDETEATARGLAYLVAGRPAEWSKAKQTQFKPAAGQNRLRERFSAWLTEMAMALKR